MSVRITPEPSDEERKAILQALAAEEAERAAASPWAAALLRPHDTEELEP